MTRAVFISHAEEDCEVASAICSHLEQEGLTCWMAPRDVRPGHDFAEQIALAIRSASVFLIVLSGSSNTSNHVKNEMSVAGDCAIPVLPVRIDDVALSDSLEYYLRRWQWFDASAPPSTGARVRGLAAAVRGLLPLPRAATLTATPNARGWVWWSRGRSPDEHVISVLGIAETLLAMSAYAFIAWRWGTLHLTIAGCVTPFLLLRTPESIALGKRWAKWLSSVIARPLSACQGLMESLPQWAGLLFAFVFMLLIPPLTLITLVIVFAAPPLIRVLSTGICAVTSPLAALRRVPTNWWRFVAGVDSLQPPDPVAGFQADELPDPYTSLADGGVLGLLARPTAFLSVKKEFGPPLLWFAVAFETVMWSPLWIPAIAYRWSIKGTALLWSPLIWVVHSTFRPGLTERLRDIRDLALHRVARGWSLFVLIAFSAKLLATTDLTLECGRWVKPSFCQHVIVPGAIPPWQLAAAVNAAIGWALYLAADWLLSRSARLTRVARSGDAILKSVWLLRGLLSLYVILCSLYLAAFLSERWRLPPLGTKLYP